MARNQIIDGVEYAVNLNGERYEVMIPGTKCPVSAKVLEDWKWKENLTLDEIRLRLVNQFGVEVKSISTITAWMIKYGIRLKTARQRKISQSSIQAGISNFSNCRKGFFNEQHKEKFFNGKSRNDKLRSRIGNVKKCVLVVVLYFQEGKAGAKQKKIITVQ